ncbi:MAG: hypothetical protein WAU47_14820 [Desulfobaccales bacterium]
METLADFVARLSKDVGCYYHRLKKSGLYPLKRNSTMQPGEMGVFAFVLEQRDRYRIHTSEAAAGTAGVIQLFDGTRERLWWRETGTFIYVRKGSIGDDYRRAVTALKAINNML